MARIRSPSHLPDFGMVSYLAEYGDSLLHRSDGYLKLAYLILIVFAATILQKIEYLLGLFLLTLMVYRLGRLPLRLLLRWYLIPVSFVSAVALPFIFNEPGAPALTLGASQIQITYSGLQLLARLLLRTLSAVTYSFSFIMTTKYSQICAIVNRILPTPINTVFLLAYRFSFVVLEEVNSLLKAVSSRGGDLVKGLLTQTRIFSGIFAVAFVHSFDRAERIAKAMEARGFDGRIKTYTLPVRLSLRGVSCLLLSAAGLISILAFG
ncbi:MAG: cobalt ECF transporter T component CbiQ [Candidatus Bathyarchaeia archaeon]